MTAEKLILKKKSPTTKKKLSIMQETKKRTYTATYVMKHS
jgi:hypothetical protein